MIILISAFVGLFASFLSTIFGGGFGLISVPAFYFIISHYYPHIHYGMQMTIATGSMCSMVLGIIASYKHAQYKNIDFNLYKNVIVYMCAGAFLGVYLLTLVHSGYLKKIFAAIVFIAAIWMIAFKAKDGEKKDKSNNIIFKFLSSIVSFISAFVGVSVFNVPFFVISGIDIKKAIGTSTLLILTYATLAGIFMIIIGIFTVGISSSHIGYLNTTIFLSTIIPCIIGSLAGSKAVRVLPSNVLKVIFVVMMLAVSVFMAF